MVFTFWRMKGVQVSTRPQVGFKEHLQNQIKTSLGPVCYLLSSKGWARSPGSSDRSLSSVALLFHNKGFACSSFFFVPLFSKGSQVPGVGRSASIGPDLQAGRTTSTSPGLSAGHPTWAISHGEPFWSSNLQKAARGEGHLRSAGRPRV